ncbi:DUF4352 domain-containing protein [Paenibacillus sp. GCM10028914]|uniref:DUF4352 domain-containing protein n=1 Tax=Paenibacillus sp. GCM10028914 TaxID=3273416 RepID=UPI00361DA107
MTIRKMIIITAAICGLVLTAACSNDKEQEPAKEAAPATVEQPEVVVESTTLGQDDQNDENKSDETDAIISEVTSTTVQAPSDQPAAIGEWLNYHGMIVKVNSVRDSEGDDYLKPQEGNVLKVLDITVVNTGDKELVVSSALSFSLSDDSGEAHMPVVTSDIKQSLDGMVAPNQVLQGEIPYEVSKNAKDLKLTFSIPLMEGEAVWTIE